MSHYLDALKQKIAGLSGKPWEEAKLDWRVIGEKEPRDFADGRCFCGYEGIKREFTIMNTKGRDRRTRTVGSNCRKNFRKESARERIIRTLTDAERGSRQLERETRTWRASLLASVGTR